MNEEWGRTPFFILHDYEEVRQLRLSSFAQLYEEAPEA